MTVGTDGAPAQLRRGGEFIGGFDGQGLPDKNKILDRKVRHEPDQIPSLRRRNRRSGHHQRPQLQIVPNPCPRPGQEFESASRQARQTFDHFAVDPAATVHVVEVAVFIEGE